MAISPHTGMRANGLRVGRPRISRRRHSRNRRRCPFGHACLQAVSANAGCPMVDAGIEAEFLASRNGISPARPRCRRRAAPLILAIWPTTEPTAPEAAATTTVSPADRLADLEQPHIGGHTRHAEDAECGLRLALAWDRPCCKLRAIGQRMASASQYGLPRYRPCAKPMHIRGNHFADGAALHHLADADRLGVGRSIAHPAAHVRIE